MTEPHRHHAKPSWGERVRDALARRSATRHQRSLGWRLAVPAVFLFAGALFVTSSISSGGTDLRPGRYENLADLVNKESDRVQALRADIAALNADVERLTAARDSAEIAEVQKQVEALRGPAGLQAVRGPGVTVTLDDAPPEVLASAGEGVSQAIVHQQDIQAVANAMWEGGAEALMIQGQRVISTTGIKCVGNSVILHGVPYSPPYVISAIGDPARMRAAIDRNPYLQTYQQAVEIYQLGWDLQEDSLIEVPAYDGSGELSFARVPAVGAGNTSDNPS